MMQQDFAAKLEISPASLSSIFTGRTNPTNNHVMAIHKAFPQINVNWLMFGEGEMYSTPSQAEGESGSAQDGGAVEGQAAAVGAELPFSDGSPRLSLFANEENSAQYTPRTETTKSGFAMNQSHERRSRDGREHYAGDNMKYIDKPQRKIKEIRVFFDDGTYEAFVPSSSRDGK